MLELHIIYMYRLVMYNTVQYLSPLAKSSKYKSSDRIVYCFGPIVGRSVGNAKPHGQLSLQVFDQTGGMFFFFFFFSLIFNSIESALSDCRQRVFLFFAWGNDRPV